jgi:glycosyltransferase involved in cell wall biosynthesis
MRLGVDASNLWVGGGLTHLIEVLRSARPSAHGIDRVTVWAGQRTAAQLPTDRPWLKIEHEPMLDRPLPARLAWQRLRLPRLAGVSCDLLFVPGGAYAGTFEPFVAMSRNLLPFEPGEARRYGTSWMRLKLALLRSRQTAAFQRARGVIFLNEYARRAVMRFVKDVRGGTAVVPHGVDGRFRRLPQAQAPLSAFSENNPLRLLYVSKVDVYKHQWRVVQGVAGLRRRGVPVDLTLVGGAYPPALRRLRGAVQRADPGGGFVRYRGEVPYRQLPELYHETEIFIFASSCESMPNILLEAMAAGLPIACAARGPMPDILGKDAAYFNPENPDSIEGAVRHLAEDRSFRERAARAAYDRAQAYTWERCAAETLDFLATTAGVPLPAGDRGR